MPATISGAAWPNHRNARLGPFELSNGDLVVVASETADGTALALFRSQDGGDSWTEIAAVLPYSVAIEAIDCLQVGDTIYAAVAASGQGITVYAINPNTLPGIWAAATGTGPIPAAGLSTYPHIYVARRSDGSFVVFYQGPTVRVMGTDYQRIYYARYTGAWLTAVEVSGLGSTAFHAYARGAVGGAFDRIHFFYNRLDNSDLYKSLSSANVLSAAQAITGSFSTTAAYPQGPVVVQGGKVRYVYRYGATNQIYDFAATDDANLTDDDVSSQVEAVTPQQTNGPPGAIAFDGTKLHVFWINEANGSLLYEDDGGTRNFSGASATLSSATCTAVCANPITNAIGYVYREGAAVVFDKVSLVSLTAVGTSRSLLFDLRSGVGPSRTLLWDLVAHVGASRTLPYDLAERVGASRSLLADVLALAGTSRALPADLRAAVGASRTLLWDLSAAATAVGVSRGLPWDLAVALGTSRAFPYDVSAKVGVSRALPYDLATALGASRALPYDLAAAVGTSRALLWDLVAHVGVPRALLWDVVGAPGVVGTSRALLWDLASAVGATCTLPYDLAAAIAVDRALLWDLRQAVAASRALPYDVAAIAGTSRGLLWDLVAHVAVSRALAYDVIGTFVQFAGPVSDVSATGWAPTPLYEQIDEETPDEVDYIEATAV